MDAEQHEAYADALFRRGSRRASRAGHAGRELGGEARVPLSVCCVLRQGGREEAQGLNEID